MKGWAECLKRVLVTRPLAVAALLYATGGWIAYLSDVPACAFGAALTLFAIVFAFRRNLFWALALFALLGATAISVACMPATVPEQRGAQVSGRVIALDESEIARIVTLDRATVNGARADTNVRMYVYEPMNASVGDTVHAAANLYHPTEKSSPGGFDSRAWLFQNGIKLTATAQNDTITVEKAAFSIRGAIDGARNALTRRIDRLLGESAPLARSILLGDKSGLDEAVYTDFRRAGVTHLLAISGLHVTCLAFVLDALLRAARLSRKWAGGLVLLFLLVYAALAGFPASVIRAMVMFALLKSGWRTGNPYDSLSGLGAAFFVLTVFQPLTMLSTGCLLSFSAVAGIVTLMPTLRGLPRANRAGRVRRYVSGALSVSLAAQLGVLPTTIFAFGQVPLYGLFANLLIVPLATVLLPVLLALLAIGRGAALARTLLWLMQALTRFFSGLPFAMIDIPEWPLWLTLAFFLALAGATTLVRHPQWARIVSLAMTVPILLTGFFIGYHRVSDGLRVAVLDAWDADAIVVEAEKNVFLVDVGLSGAPTTGYLRYLGAPVAGVFLTHPHLDHAGGLAELLAIRDIPTLYLPWCWDAFDSYAAIGDAVELARSRGTQIQYLAAGDVVRLSENVSCEVLAPARDSLPAEENAASLVLHLTYFDGAALLPGDLPADSEPDTLKPAGLLKAAHHASADANSAFLLRAVAPSAIVVSTGSDKALAYLTDSADRLGMRLYRTNRDGTVTTDILPDGTVKVATYL